MNADDAVTWTSRATARAICEATRLEISIVTPDDDQMDVDCATGRVGIYFVPAESATGDATRDA